MASAGTVTLNLDANSVRLLRELQKSQRATQRTARGMRTDMNRAFKSISRTAKIAGAAIVTSFGANLVRGVAQAGISMERMERSLKAATGSAGGAKNAMAFVASEAQRLGLNLESAGQQFAKLSAAAKGTALEGEQTKRIFTAISESSRVLGLSADQTTGALRAIEQMISKGTVQAEELRGQLGERLPGAFQIAARAMGKTTQELGKMLENGEVLADELLPALATELRNTFGGEVEAASSDAAAAFERFQTSVFNLKVAIANSGLLSLMQDIAESFTKATAAVSGFFNTTDQERAEQLKQQISEAQLRVDRLTRRGGDGGKTGREAQLRLTGLEFELELLQTKIEKEKQIVDQQNEQMRISQIMMDMRQGRSSTSSANELFASAEKDLEKAIQRDDADFKSFADSLKTADDELADYALTIERFKDQLTDEQFREALRQLEEMRMEGLEEIDLGPIRAMKKEIKEVDAGTTELGFTFQSAFEDAIIEGEKLRDVMQGLLKDILRIAIRSSITGPLGASLGGFFSGIFGGPRAMGGPVSAGTGYLVGEKGPELFVPQSNGNIIPNGAGGTSVTYNIDARGADEARIMRVLPPILERNRQQTIAEIQGLKMQGRF